MIFKIALLEHIWKNLYVHYLPENCVSSYIYVLIKAKFCICSLQKHDQGQVLLDVVFKHLDLTERDYFGLQLADESTDNPVSWLCFISTVLKLIIMFITVLCYLKSGKQKPLQDCAIFPSCAICEGLYHLVIMIKLHINSHRFGVKYWVLCLWSNVLKGYCLFYCINLVDCIIVAKNSKYVLNLFCGYFCH